MTGYPAIASKIPSKSDCWTGRSRSSAARRAFSSPARIISCTTGRRSGAMNMCSVRQSPIPSAPNSRAFAASSGVSAFARTRMRRRSSAQSRIVPKFSSIAGGTSGTEPTITRPVPPSTVELVSLAQLDAPDLERARGHVDRERVAPRDAGLAHPAGDDGRVRGHPAVRGEDAAGVDEPVDVVRRRLPADEDDVLARAPLLLGEVGVEHDRARRRARRRVEPRRHHVDLGGRVDHRVEQLVELSRGRSARRPPRVRSAPRPASRRRRAGPPAPCACRCGSGAGRARRPRP